MEKSDIEKALAAFEAKLKPMQAAKVVEHPAPIMPPVPPPPEPEPVVAGAVPCFNKPFKDMIKALDDGYVGNSTGKPFLVEFMDTQVPECGVTS